MPDHVEKLSYEDRIAICDRAVAAFAAEATRWDATDHGGHAADHCRSDAVVYNARATLLRKRVIEGEPSMTLLDEEGHFHASLLAAWTNAKVGDPCARCGAVLGEYLWTGSTIPVCLSCQRDFDDAHGDPCCGLDLCAECLAAGCAIAMRKPKCKPSCSTLCGYCSPDD